MKLILITLVAVVVGLVALACTATPNIDATVEAAISATKTAEQGQQNLTYKMIEGILSQYWEAAYEAEFPEEGVLNGAECVLGNRGYPNNPKGISKRMADFNIGFSPEKKMWRIQATGQYCDGIEFFYINDVTGKLSR
jgi:hypothetical protein